MPNEYLIGMMSGTSADGIDVALVEFSDSGQIRTLDTQFSAYSNRLQEEVNTVAQTNLAQLGDPAVQALHQELAEAYAHAATALIMRSGIASKSISAIANHGQTVAHRPDDNPPESLQIGDPQKLANLTGVRVISQFRQADLAVGGQGAPLMPAFHNILLENAHHGRRPETKPLGNVYVLNLGGIANISAVPSCGAGNLLGFDTGPANTLMNQWIKLHKNQSFDAGGKWASSGSVVSELLVNLMQEPYFARQYPKSTGPDYFNIDWLNRLGGDLAQYKPRDVQATLMALTVKTVGLGLKQTGAKAGTIFVCGGGANNPVLMRSLNDSLNGFEISTTARLGVPPDWVEATGFAWLGHCYLNGKTSNCPSVTGATQSVVLGEEWLPE